MNISDFLSMFPQKLKKGYALSNKCIGLIYIRGDMLMYYTDIYKKATDFIEKNCSFTVFANNIPKDNLILLLTDLEDPKKFKELGTNKYSIICYGTVLTFPNAYPEIYNLCTAKKYRGKGYMKRFLSCALRELPSNLFSLGIDLKNPMFESALKVYTQVGFKSIGIRKITPGDVMPGFPFLLLGYDKNYITDSSAEFSKGISMHKEYTPYGCKIPVIISKNVVDFIRKYIWWDAEYAGVLYVLGKEKGNRYRLGLPKDRIIEGDTEKVRVETYFLSWHSHPYICYKKNNCFIGWPSGTDLGMLINQYYSGNIGHIVFSAEGMYICSVNKELMSIMSSLSKDCVDTLSEVAALIGGSLLNYRSVDYDKERIECYKASDQTKQSFIKCLTYDSTAKRNHISNVLKILNGFTLYKAIDEALRLDVSEKLNQNIEELYNCLNKVKARKDIRLFNMTFHRYPSDSDDDLLIDLDYLISPTESRCPIPEKKSPDVIR